MELYEAIDRRRTVRTFMRPAPQAALKRIILAGSKAASAGGRQPWEFIVVDDADIIDQIAAAKHKQNMTIQYANATQEEVEARALRQKNAYKNCSVVAVCYVDDEDDLAGAWMAVQNMYLAATAEALGLVPSTFWGRHQKKVSRLLGLPEGFRVATVCLIGLQEGYPDNFKEPRRPRRPESSWLHHNKF